MVGQADNIEPHPLGHIGQVEDSERTVGGSFQQGAEHQWVPVITHSSEPFLGCSEMIRVGAVTCTGRMVTVWQRTSRPLEEHPGILVRERVDRPCRVGSARVKQHS